jgi:hypothetical protein
MDFYYPMHEMTISITLVTIYKVSQDINDNNKEKSCLFFLSEMINDK